MGSDSTAKANKQFSINGDRIFVLCGGVITAIFHVAFGYWLKTTSLPTPNLPTMADRIAFALKWQALSAFAMIIGVVWVGNRRFLSPAINPLDENAKKYVELPLRYLTNTVEQFLLHFVACLTLSVYLPLDKMVVLPLLSIIFLTARFLFAVGYSIHYIFRAPGFSFTITPTICSFVYCMYCLYKEQLDMWKQ